MCVPSAPTTRDALEARGGSQKARSGAERCGARESRGAAAPRRFRANSGRTPPRHECDAIACRFTARRGAWAAAQQHSSTAAQQRACRACRTSLTRRARSLVAASGMRPDGADSDAGGCSSGLPARRLPLLVLGAGAIFRRRRRGAPAAAAKPRAHRKPEPGALRPGGHLPAGRQRLQPTACGRVRQLGGCLAAGGRRLVPSASPCCPGQPRHACAAVQDARARCSASRRLAAGEGAATTPCVCGSTRQHAP
jgi:hypothetical protein